MQARPTTLPCSALAHTATHVQVALSFGWATRPALKGVLSLLGFAPPSSLGDALLLVVPLLVCMVAAVARVQAVRKRTAAGKGQVLYSMHSGLIVSRALFMAHCLTTTQLHMLHRAINHYTPALSTPRHWRCSG